MTKIHNIVASLAEAIDQKIRDGQEDVKLVAYPLWYPKGLK